MHLYVPKWCASNLPQVKEWGLRLKIEIDL